ncbi:MAG: tetratricopeptide repeat protein [Xanthomonadales bacterium]|nr:tetratricopeptide repeat protein [Xanthomonadales bacterium]
MSIFNELKRRNVFKVAIAYAIVAWLLLQVSDTLVPALHLPEWFNSGVAFVLIIGFPIAVIFAWAFEMTPEGIKKEKDVDRSQSVTMVTSQKLNNAIIGLLVVALGYFAIDKFVIDPKRDAVEIATAIEDSREQIPEPAESPATGKSIAVLPFVNMSSDKEQEYFSDGLSEELLNLLAKIPELHVAARTSSFSFKGQSIEIPEIAARLKVDHVLEGSVRKSGNQLRITAQLIQADNGYHLWSETYDRQMDNVFQIQDEIATAVVQALKITLLGEAPRVRETTPEAYQLYLEGQHIRRQLSAPTLPKAISLLKQAVEIDPEYAPAWVELSYAYMWESGIGATPIDVAFPLADQAIERALEADPGYSQAYSTRGISNLYNKFNFQAGFQDLQLALQFEPGNAYLIGSNATATRILGRLDESIRLYETALELDPLMTEMRSWQGLAYLYAGQLDEAEAAFLTTLNLSSELSGGHFRLGRVLLRKGRLDAALAEMELEAQGVYRSTGLSMVHHALGNFDASQSMLDELIEIGSSSAAYQIAEVYGFRNEPDKAFEWLEEALVIRDSGITSILGDPALRGLRTDPRWQPFLEKLGLLEFWLEMPPEHGGPVQ